MENCDYSKEKRVIEYLSNITSDTTPATTPATPPIAATLLVQVTLLFISAAALVFTVTLDCEAATTFPTVLKRPIQLKQNNKLKQNAK